MKVLICGTGGHYTAIYNLLHDLKYHIVGTIAKKNANFNDIEDAVNTTQCQNIIIVIGNNKIRKNIMENYSECNFPTLVHPSAYIGQNIKIGNGQIHDRDYNAAINIYRQGLSITDVEMETLVNRNINEISVNETSKKMSYLSSEAHESLAHG